MYSIITFYSHLGCIHEVRYATYVVRTPDLGCIGPKHFYFISANCRGELLMLGVIMVLNTAAGSEIGAVLAAILRLLTPDQAIHLFA